MYIYYRTILVHYEDDPKKITRLSDILMFLLFIVSKTL